MLCDFCSSLDFAAIGLHDFSAPARDFAKDRKIRDILQCSPKCVFCKSIADFCYRWKSRKYGDLESMRFEDTSASISTYNLKSSESDDNGNPLAYLIYLSVTVTTKKPDPFRGYCGPSAYFQRFGDASGTVSNFVQEDVLTRDIEPYSGRLRPLLADLRLFRKWKDICRREHQGLCDALADTTKKPLRLIDVEKCLVVDEYRNVSFVALSYVWGEGTKPLLTQKTKAAFYQEGSLNERTLPATIYDAFVVTRALGERYLWVDSCCIVQDDEFDKLMYVPRMDLIYGSASVTIIATSGVGAEAGLPGVKPRSRKRDQKPFTAREVQLMETLDPNGNGDAGSYVGESIWNERGWTFQERLLSRRALVFTDEQVYWECRVASWSEDSYREFTSAPTIYRHSLDDDFTRQPLNPDTENFEQLYRTLVEKYSARLFTNEDDYLNGFEGILQIFKKAFDEPCIWGLPESFVSSALSWPCETSSRSARRRTGFYSYRDALGSTTKCRFPSWSWVGWACEVLLAQCSDELQPNTTGLEFYIIERKDQLRLISEHKAASGEHGPERRLWKGAESLAIPYNLPSGVLYNPSAKAALCFWSSVANLSVYHGDVEFPSDRRVYGSKELEFAVRWKHVPSSLSATSNVFSAAVVGDTDTWGGDKDYLNVMLISWVKGIAYREGMLSMLESDWLLLDREWTQITLC